MPGMLAGMMSHMDFGGLPSQIFGGLTALFIILFVATEMAGFVSSWEPAVRTGLLATGATWASLSLAHTSKHPEILWGDPGGLRRHHPVLGFPAPAPLGETPGGQAEEGLDLLEVRNR